MGAVTRAIREVFISWMIAVFTKSDIVRYETLKLTAQEIHRKKVQGCVAELGVYKGDFSKEINALFPDRKLFLFDTFAGFDKRDVKTEGENYCKKYIYLNEGYFTNSSIELVLKRMKHRDKCIIKKGWFPETAKNIDEKFVFVSIDADLFAPVYAGLVYFYPRLEVGGYIFVHDYNGEVYGAKEAVIQFATENSIPYFPMCDVAGTVVFAK
jgi:O-methyltransferase